MSQPSPPARLLGHFAISALLAVCVTGSSAQDAEPPALARVEPARFAEPFRVGKLANLNPAGDPAPVDLAAVIGRRAVVLYYWIPGNPLADEMFRELQELVAGLDPERISLYGVTFPQPGRGAEMVARGVERLGIRVPVLDDEGFALGQRLRVQSVPNVTIVDREGKLRLTNGASLSQVLEYNMNLAAAIERAARKGSLGTYGYLPVYYPARELIGKASPDFKARSLDDPEERSLSAWLDTSKLNVLIFWSVDCPHCRSSLPEISAWLRENGEGLNVLSAAKITSAEIEARTKEFCATNDLAFRTLVDRDLEISRLYQITSTPTFVVISPQGVIEDVLLTAGDEVKQQLDQQRRRLLGTGSS